MSRRTRRARWLGAAAGIVVDALAGEPPVTPHPVAAFGRLMRWAEARWYRDGRAAGVRHVLAGVAVGGGVGAALTAVVGSTGGATGAATYLAAAGRALREAAGGVAAALESGDLDRARELLPALVGRDVDALDEKELARAAVESVAENTVDALVAPALWAAALGAPGALAHRAVNTLDAQVGHRSPHYANFGWASARFDDAAAYVPARVCALLVAAVRPAAAREVWTAVRRDAPAHPSPNAGVAEAAFAAALGLRLGGTNAYGGRVEVRPVLGRGRPPEAHDIGRACRLSRDVGLALAGALAAGAHLWRGSR